MPIILDNRLEGDPVNELKLKRRLGKVLKALGRPKASLGVLLAGDAELRGLNRDFRGKDAPTNVLAFPFEDGDAAGAAPESPAQPLPSVMKGYLGDVAVSLETVARQAEETGAGTGELLYFYLIHGILHLTGHDHELGPAEAEAQDRETERLLGLIPRTLK
ncbi:MAG: rRNA maturation RNase YbeY [Deltaproteobacteria bacterium]|jgi:probable rRNA maturation factor|nr:rRNA maturation RNase YbeY [Deltaproteobacteria bacterium]